MRPIFGRIGSNRLTAKYIIPLFPEHTKYVEAFVGGGSIYFLKEKSKEEVINDLELELIDGYKAILEAKPEYRYTKLNTIALLTDYLKEPIVTPTDVLVNKIINSCNGFSGRDIINTVYKTSDPIKKILNIEKYQKRMKDTKICSEDYKVIIEREDSLNTFFFLDPPYEKSTRLYKHGSFNYKELLDILQNIKGKFMLNVNGSDTMRDMFKEFKITEIIEVRKTTINKDVRSNIGSKERVDLLIMNY